MNIDVMVVIPGKKPGERLGIVRFYEAGYYPVTADDPEWTDEQAAEFAKNYNESHCPAVSEDVVQSAFEASMFGWHVPAAKPATDFFKERDAKSKEFNRP